MLPLVLQYSLTRTRIGLSEFDMKCTTRHAGESIVQEVSQKMPVGLQIYKNQRSNYHITLFHTSKIHDPRPDAIDKSGGVPRSAKPCERPAPTPVRSQRERRDASQMSSLLTARLGLATASLDSNCFCCDAQACEHLQSHISQHSTESDCRSTSTRSCSCAATPRAPRRR
jgi:hypothetical protein